MVAPLARALPVALGHGETHLRVAREVDLGLIIPDLLVGVWHADAPVARAAGTYVDSCVLAQLEAAGGHSTESLAEHLYLSRWRTEEVLARLAQKGTIVRRRSGTWNLAPAAGTRHIEIVAIEAKLTRWRDALAQAAAYLEFADRAVVVLDGAQVRTTPAMLAAFRDARVGLWLQHGDVVAPFTTAPRHRPVSARRVIAADRLFAPHRSSTASTRDAVA
jgi:predicted transcriptional regulator